MKQRIAQSTLNKELNKELCNLRETLVAIDKDNTQSMDTLSVHTEKISNVVQKISTQNLDPRQFRPNPFHIILSVGTLSKTEIPLDVLRILISAGFDVNGYIEHHELYQTCLPIAIFYHHYSAMRVLLDQGAVMRTMHYDDKSESYDITEENPLTSLAKRQNVPLDLFDLLVERHRWPVNQHASKSYPCMPLHTAASHGRTENALRLIKLGARVDIVDKSSRLPIYHFVKNYTSEFSYELFIVLLPSKTQGIDLIRIIYTLLDRTKLENKLKNNVLLEMLHQLLQRLTFVQPLKVVCKETSNISMTIIWTLHLNLVETALMHGLQSLLVICC